MTQLKPDAQVILDVLESLKQRYRNDERSWWPDFVFHFTDILNAVEILKCGAIYSRRRLKSLGLQHVDAASPAIIERSIDYAARYTRCYFRPLTPTQNRMEGIRPASECWKDDGGNPAHCPVPVFLLFDARSILVREDCEFTDGNYASTRAIKGSTGAFFPQLPFNHIYHTGSYDPRRYPQIRFHRCAEVLIPDQIDLQSLRIIACRTTAEKETLQSLLPFEMLVKYHNIIRVPPYKLFEKRWTYVESVELRDEMITIRFSPDSETPGPFIALFEVSDLESGELLAKKEYDNFNIVPSFSTKLPEPLERYKFRLSLDGHIAYENAHQPLPF